MNKYERLIQAFSILHLGDLFNDLCAEYKDLLDAQQERSVSPTNLNRGIALERRIR